MRYVPVENASPDEDASVRFPVTECSPHVQVAVEHDPRGEPHNGTYSYELIRRAIVLRDEACRAEVTKIYGSMVLFWCSAAVSWPDIDYDEMVPLTWEKFWRSLTAEKLAACSSASSTIQYLKMCACSVAFDMARARRGTVPLKGIATERTDPAPSPKDVAIARATVVRILRSEQERVYVYLAYELGYRSTQIQAQRPDLFPCVQDVYRVARNVLDRLRRSPELRA